jgi:translation initiation factor IF-3
VIFRGREIQHTALAEQLLFRMAQDLADNAEIQQPPKREGRNMIMFLSPRRLPGGKVIAKPMGRADGKPTELRTIETRVIETKPSQVLVSDDSEAARPAS